MEEKLHIVCGIPALSARYATELLISGRVRHFSDRAAVLVCWVLGRCSDFIEVIVDEVRPAPKNGTARGMRVS
jgi:hypothetical protein